MSQEHKKKKPKKNSDAKPATHGLEHLARQVAELTEALQRERADAMNVRRRHDEQLAGIRDMVKASVVRELLPVIDNFERAMKHVPADIADHDYVQGVSSVAKQFEKTLEIMGVTKIKTVGEAFNPELHEAVSMQDNGGDNEIIVEELQAGYTLGKEVLRHALVKVERK